MEFNKLVEDYGCLAFTDDVMKERIPKMPDQLADYRT